MTAGPVSWPGGWTRALGATLRGPRSVLRRPGGRPLLIGIGLVLVIVVGSPICRLVLGPPNSINFAATLQAPSLAHPFGTDDLGRDLLSRVAAGTWLDLSLAFGATAISIVVGVMVGTIAGYLGGWPERIIMRIADFVIAFPYLVLVLAIIAIIGPGVLGMFVALISGGWAFYARFSRAEILVLRNKQFIQAAQTLGFSHRRVMFRHALPNLIRPSVVYSFSDVVGNILFVAALSFLGLGVRPPTPEWGAIMSDGQNYLLSAWWITTIPGLVVVFFGLACVLIGDALGELLGVQREKVVR